MINFLGVNQELLQSASFIAMGVSLALKYAFVGVLGGFFLGLFLAFLQRSRFLLLRFLASAYLSIFRGTPMLVQISIFYFGLPSLLDISISAFVAGGMALAFNSAAYIAEIIRSGLSSVDKGQYEAASALGVSHYRLMKDIILPQAFRNILPALVNETITLLKDTALISIIGGHEIMRRAQLIAAETYDYFTPLLIAALYYYLLVMIISYLGKKMEQRLDYNA